MSKLPRPKEEDVHAAVCKFIDLQYPNIIYLSDASGIRLPVGLAVKFAKLRCKRYKIPDLIILHPNKVYHGLIIEIKRDRDEVYTKRGEIKKSEHIQEQFKSLVALSDLGYCALMRCGFDEVVDLIKIYMAIN